MSLHRTHGHCGLCSCKRGWKSNRIRVEEPKSVHVGCDERRRSRTAFAGLRSYMSCIAVNTDGNRIL